MKRFLCLFLVALVCISLCVNIAFASDVITAPVDQNILVYFPWFGGVSGSSASRVTNYATVTSSDITTTGVTFTNSGVTDRLQTGVQWTSNSNGTVSLVGTLSNYFTYAYIPLTQGHRFFIQSSESIGIRINAGAQFNSDITAFYTDYINSVDNRVYYYGSTNETLNKSIQFNVYDVSEIFGVGNEPDSFSYSDFVSVTGLSFPQSYGTLIGKPVSSFSLVPAPAANGGSSTHQINDYTWYQYSADVSLTGSSDINRVYNAYFLDNVTYSWYVEEGTNTSSTRANLLYYMPSEAASALNQYMIDRGSNTRFNPITLGTPYSYTNNGYTVTNLSSLIYFCVDHLKLPFSSNTIFVDDLGYYFTSLSVGRDSQYGVLGDYGYTTYYSGLEDVFNLESLAYVGDDTYTGTFTIDRIFRTIDNSYFLFNNQVNLGTYDFNVNVKFPSLEKFNSFAGYWMATFNTSWGEIPVRTEIQEVSSNSDTLIKIYKLTFDVPFTGQYTKFNIKYVGDSSAFTTMRVDASVIDPNGYQNGAGPTTINGLSFYLTSLFDKFWGKVRSLFFDNDQTMAESVPAEAGELAGEVSSGAQSIHEFETNNFDSIETQQEQVDWNIPTDFGSATDSSSAIGFVSMLFMGVYQSLGVKVQYVIVVPLILGLVLLILGRGSMALGKLVDSMKR